MRKSLENKDFLTRRHIKATPRQAGKIFNLHCKALRRQTGPTYTLLAVLISRLVQRSALSSSLIMSVGNGCCNYCRIMTACPGGKTVVYCILGSRAGGGAGPDGLRSQQVCCFAAESCGLGG